MNLMNQEKKLLDSGIGKVFDRMIYSWAKNVGESYVKKLMRFQHKLTVDSKTNTGYCCMYLPFND